MISALCLTSGQSKNTQDQNHLNQSISQKELKNYVLRKFDEELIKNYRTDDQFNYSTSVPNSFFSELLSWLSKWIGKLFENTSEKKIGSTILTIIKAIAWIIGIFSIIMIIQSFVRHGAFNIIARNDKKNNHIIDFETLDNQVLEADWEALIKQELSAGRFGVTVRLLYLQTLQSLHRSNMIEWKKEKTSFQYIQEIRASSSRGEAFQELVQYYNYAWFGGFVINSSHFDHIHTKFQNFNKALID